MNAELLLRNIQYLKFQRNAFLAISFCLAVSLIAISFFLFFKQERIVVVPQNIDKAIWVQGSKVSPSYLEQQSLFLSQLLLNKTPQTVKDQNLQLLRFASPEFYGDLKEKLEQEQKKILEQGASFVFFLKTSEVFLDKMQVKLTGERQVYLGGQIVSRSQEACILSFRMSGQIPFLSGVKILTGGQNAQN